VKFKSLFLKTKLENKTKECGEKTHNTEFLNYFYKDPTGVYRNEALHFHISHAMQYYNIVQ
jgi:hypothetical protein